MCLKFSQVLAHNIILTSHVYHVKIHFGSKNCKFYSSNVICNIWVTHMS